MQFLLTIITCNGRERVLADTLASLKETDWGEEPLVWLDTFNLKDRTESQTKTAKALLEATLHSKWDYLVFCEDDVIFNKHLRHNLEHWSALQMADFKCGILYTGDEAGEVRKDYWQVDATHHGGSQAVVIQREWLPKCLNTWHQIGGMQDMRLFKGYRKVAQYMPSCFPNIVQHRTEESTWGGNKHTSPTFSLDWKAPC